MLSKKRKSESGEISGRRKRNPLISGSSPTSLGEGKVNEKGQFLVITDHEFARFCSMTNKLSGTYKLSKESEARTNDSPLLLHSDTDRHHQSLSQNLLDSEIPILQYARRSVKTRSTSKMKMAINTFGDCRDTVPTTVGVFEIWNSRLKLSDNAVRKSDVSFVVPIRKGISTENVLKAAANFSNGMILMEEPPMAFAIGVDRLEENACRLTQTFSFGLSHMANICDLDSVKDEVEVESPAVGTILGYRVKKEYECVLRSIIEKYGDIAAEFIMESQKNRSSVLEDICEIVQILERKRLNVLSRKEIQSFLSQIRDFGKAGMKVDWLQKRLESVFNAKCLLKQMPTLKERRDKNGVAVKELKSKLKHYEAQCIILKEKRDKDAERIIELQRNLKYYDAEMQKFQESANSTKKDLVTEEGEAETIKQVVSDARSKVLCFIEHSLMDGLL